MRILHVTKKYPNALGGDANSVSNLEKQQTKEGNEVFILTTNCDEIINKKKLIKFGLKDMPSNLDNITLKRILSLFQLRFKFKKILRKINPDVVHCHSIDIGYVISKSCRKFGIPIVNTFRTDLFSLGKEENKRRILGIFLNKHSRFSARTVLNKAEFNLMKKNGFENVFCIPNGIDTSIFKSLKNISQKRNVVLFTGRFTEWKGIREILTVAKQLPEYKFWFAGGGELEKEIKGKNIKNLGFIQKENLVEVYNQATICIFPSWYEPFGNVAREAMACQRAVIVTPKGFSETIENGKDGIIIPAKDENTLKEAIVDLMTKEKKRKMLEKNARKKAENCSWEKVNKKFEKIYREVLK